MGNRSSNPKPAPIPQPKDKELSKPVIYRTPSSCYEANRRATYETDDSDSEELSKRVINRTPCSGYANRSAAYETWHDIQRNFSSWSEPKPSFPTPQPRYFAQELPNRPIRHTGGSSTSYHASGGVNHENYNNWDAIQINFQLLSINDQAITNYASRDVRPPTIVTKNSTRLDPHLPTNPIVSCIPLSENDSEYAKVNKMITNKRRFKVDGIEKIENPTLKKAYALKKEEKEKKFGHVEERLLFHGTLQSNVESICKFNFDWRFCNAHQFGNGVCFSPNANYASNLHSDKTYNKVMIVAKVMIGKSVFGRKIQELPYLGYDTFQKGDGIVVVKYADDEFCPLYKINYHLAANVQYQSNNKGHRIRPQL